MSPSQESVESISKSLRRASQLFQSEPQKAGDVGADVRHGVVDPESSRGNL